MVVFLLYICKNGNLFSYYWYVQASDILNAERQ